MNSILFLKQTDFSLSLFPEQLESAFAKKIVTDDIQQTEEYIDVEQFDCIAAETNSISDELKQFFLRTAQKTNSALLLLADSAEKNDVMELSEAGVIVFASPIKADDVEKALIVFAANKRRILTVETQLSAERATIEEERLIARAKTVLGRYLNMTEQQAHRYIERQSMNLRQSKIQTAESIKKHTKARMEYGKNKLSETA